MRGLKNSNCGCGLMQKKDITQHKFNRAKFDIGCGLMQKKDITQPQ